LPKKKDFPCRKDGIFPIIASASSPVIFSNGL
jgi:hypothetical protein